MVPDLGPRRGRFTFPARRGSVFVEFPRALPITPSFVEVRSPVRGLVACNLSKIGFLCSLQPDVLIERPFPVYWEAVI